MAFAGNCGVSVDLPAPAADPHGAMAALFAEELGLVLEVAAEDEAAVLAAFAAAGVPCSAIGATAAGQAVSVSVGGQQQISGTTPALRDVWEATSFQLERLQCAEENVEAEQSGLAARTAPQWRVPFTPAWTPADKLSASGALCWAAAARGCESHPCSAPQKQIRRLLTRRRRCCLVAAPQARSRWPSFVRRAPTATVRWRRRCMR